MTRMVYFAFIFYSHILFASKLPCSSAIENLKNSTRITPQESPILVKKRYALVRDGGLCAMASVGILLTSIERQAGNKEARFDYRELMRLTDRASQLFKIDARKGLMDDQIQRLLEVEAKERGFDVKVKYVDMESKSSRAFPFKQNPNSAYIVITGVYFEKNKQLEFKWQHASIAYNYDSQKQILDVIDPHQPNKLALKARIKVNQEYPELDYRYRFILNSPINHYPKNPRAFLSGVFVIEFFNRN